ncbi:unnamed protein product [Vitrella brassicaformis CCMP3155]|uniref:Uncharacterized protein n=1 Tax=Vitrella brassicaformis (strain CCMP3155) TaxID=1169540 RepID=A0A0G4G515_VITBC|nr:unnamed protein product [Vitrella brassicaformis CCMP3155]|eukprot:CEM23498.1 unnamed protein product [Vitrella brassicaformis CCMP3155]
MRSASGSLGGALADVVGHRGGVRSVDLPIDGLLHRPPPPLRQRIRSAAAPHRGGARAGCHDWRITGHLGLPIHAPLWVGSRHDGLHRAAMRCVSPRLRGVQVVAAGRKPSGSTPVCALIARSFSRDVSHPSIDSDFHFIVIGEPRMRSARTVRY